MLTTSPACSARQSNSRIVRTSTRAVSPSFEIWQDVGSTHQAPMRSMFERSMQVFRTIQGVSGLAQDSSISAAYRTPWLAAMSATNRSEKMKRNALLAIGVGGLAAGVLDLTQALYLFGAKVPLAIA